MVPIGLYDTLVATREPERPDSRRLSLGRAAATASRSGRAARRGRQSGHRAVDAAAAPRWASTHGISHRAGQAHSRRPPGWAADRAMRPRRCWPPTRCGISAGRARPWPRSAAELGSDVPFFLGRGAAICRGRGERVEPVGGVGALDFVVVRPPEGLSTAAVYAQLPRAAEPRRMASAGRGACAAATRGALARLDSQSAGRGRRAAVAVDRSIAARVRQSRIAWRPR